MVRAYLPKLVKRTVLRGRMIIVCALMSLTPLLASCGGDDPAQTPTIGPTATTAPNPTVTPSASIEPIVWAASVDPATNAPIEPVEQFSTDDLTIYAVVRVASVPAGAVLSAAWTYNDASLDSAAQAIVPSQAYRAGYVQFHLTRSDNQTWPPGNYALTIMLDGSVVQTAAVSVVES